MTPDERTEFMIKIQRAYNLHRWALQANDMESAGMWAGDLLALALEGSGISDKAWTKFLKTQKRKSIEV